MKTRGSIRWVAAAVVTAGVSGMLMGCTAVIPPPPLAVTAVVDHAVAMMQAIEGVASADSRISADVLRGGPLSRAEAWSASISIEVESNLLDLEAVSSGVEHEVAAANATVATCGTIRIPADAGGVQASLTFSSHDGYPAGPLTPAELAAAAMSLRGVEGVTDVQVADDSRPARVSVDSPREWPRVAAGVRAVPGFGDRALAAVTLDSSVSGSLLTLNAVSPHPRLIADLSALAMDPAIDVLAYSGASPSGNSSGLATWRPSLYVRVSADAAGQAAEGSTAAPTARSKAKAAAKADVERITAMLVHLDDSQTAVEGIPRASFTVSTDVAASSAETAATTIEEEGYVGLPLGSAEPDDHIVPANDPAALGIPLEADAAAARLQSDQLLVEQLLNDAGDAAGIRGPSQVAIAACTSGAGEQVTGSVVIPIFEIADSADDAFDAITSSWVAEGYSATDRAMGRDFYSLVDPHDDGAEYVELELLSIRGTADGISIQVQSECIVAT
ncbi:hypothetical protein [Leifsonia sp. A12D58]|uniref:hypothetical protein n=1 Tax=Leifsonia sp. A12D58 TaxID=3397674 RepID=UPI0039E0EA67